MIYKRVVYLFLTLFLIAYSSENMQDDKNANLPNDIKGFIKYLGKIYRTRKC